MSDKKAEQVQDMLENALLMLTYYEKLDGHEESRQLRSEFSKLLTLPNVAKGSISLAHVIFQEYCSETGKTKEEAIQMIRSKLLQVLNAG